MILEDQVCALEYAKKLKALGVKQTALFFYAEYPHFMQQQKDGSVKCVETITDIRGASYWRDNEIESWAAFTTAELGEMLPQFIETDILAEIGMYIDDECYKADENDELTVLDAPREYHIAYTSRFCDRMKAIHSVKDHNEANARAKCLIMLIESGLMKNEND